MTTVPFPNSSRSSASVSATPVTGLIPTKLHGPRVRPDLVVRPHLMQRLEDGLWRKLSLISAAAGSGKTTLVAQWLKDTPTLVAWLSLDEADNEIHRFLTYLMAALRTVKPQLGEGIENLMQAPGPIEPEQLLANLVVIPLVQEPDPIVLVLDDYHVVDNPAIHQAITWLLDHLPPRLHLMITTRHDPPLPLARLRVRDELNEFRAEELRFSETEAGIFFNQVMQLELAPDDIAALEARTEGWAAAIQLSALSLRDQTDKHAFIEALQGHQRPFADYLVQEVLEHQPPEVKDFLLRTSVLRRLCGPLCTALIDEVDGQAMLERLERSNLFIVPLDSRNEWYRYNHLFAELLRQRREQELPGEAAALHRRASEWYAEQGLAHEAVDHARRSGDQPWLATLIERWGEVTFMRSDLGTLSSWLNALSDEVLVRRPWLAVFDAWCALPGIDFQRTENALARAEHARNASDVADAERTRLQAHIMAIQSFAASRRGDPQLGIELAQEALQELPQSELFLRSVLGLSVGHNLMMVGKHEQALPLLDEAQSAACRCGNYHSAIAAMCSRAWIEHIRGRLREAQRICQEAIDVVEREGFGRLASAGYAHVEMARLHFERFELEETVAQVEQFLGQCILGVDRTFLIPAYVLLIQARLVQGDHAAARAVIAKAVSLPPETEWNEETRIELQAAQALAALLENDIAGCQHWLGDYDLNDLDPSATQHPLNVVRVRLAIQQGLDVTAVLERQITEAEIQGRLGHSLEWRVLKTVALVHGNKTDGAVAELERAVNQARPERALRVFAEHWETLKPLVPQLSDTESQPYLAVLDGEPATAAKPTMTAPVQMTELVEPLSGRELDVLQLAARGLSNQAIADKLFVSVGTVKTHMHNILAKFEVRNRTEAVHRARQLGLVVDD